MASIDIGPDSDLKLDRGSRATATSLGPHLSRLLGRLNIEGTVVLLLLVIAWQVASLHLPPILFPSLSRIAGRR